MDRIKKYIKELCEIPSPTGHTERIRSYVLRELSSLGFTPRATNAGAIYVKLTEEKEPGVLLSAHLDTLGLMVRCLHEDGTLGVTRVGSYPYIYGEGENLTVHTLDGRDYSATLRLKDPAVHYNRELETAKREDDTMVGILDEKVFTKEDVLELGILPGDAISLDPRYREVNGFIKSRHLDDKASAGMLLALAEEVSQKRFIPQRGLSLLFTVYEETGSGAPVTGGDPIKDFIAVDMGVVGGETETDEYRVSICRKDSSGPYDETLVKELVTLARKGNLAFATDIYPYYSGDASVAMRAGHDYRFGLMGTGVAASHGYERIHEEGLANTFTLLKKFLGNK